MESFPLHAGTGFKAANGFGVWRSEWSEVIPHRGVGALESAPAEFLMKPDGRNIWIARQQRCDLILKRIEHAFRLAFAARQRAGSGLLVFTDNPVDAFTADTERLGDPAAGCFPVLHPDDLVAYRFFHCLHTPSPCRRSKRPLKRHRA